jgi:hypothetical protein
MRTQRRHFHPIAVWMGVLEDKHREKYHESGLRRAKQKAR